ncbi:MAG: hypothetical protein PHH68_07965 [Candidatus Omnitrophica bacterium]|nr:hypothetical protein [Candidatus Omnitrophota bacterium]
MAPPKWIIVLTILLAIGLLIIYGGAFIDYKWKVDVAEKNIIRIYRGDEKIYEGKQAFTRIWLGNTVKSSYEIVEVVIYKKLFPYPITDKTYVDKDIKVEPGHNLNQGSLN